MNRHTALGVVIGVVLTVAVGGAVIAASPRPVTVQQEDLLSLVQLVSTDDCPRAIIQKVQEYEQEWFVFFDKGIVFAGQPDVKEFGLNSKMTDLLVKSGNLASYAKLALDEELSEQEAERRIEFYFDQVLEVRALRSHWLNKLVTETFETRLTSETIDEHFPPIED